MLVSNPETMSEDASFSNLPSYGEKNSRKSHFVTIFFAILLGVVVLLIGLYFLGAYKKGQLQSIIPSRQTSSTGSVQQSTPAPSEKPTATPTPVKLDRGELEIIVLNGSGVAGAAGDISTALKDLGYTVKSVGNASKFDYKGVTIFIKEDKKEYVEMLKKDLADKDATIETSFDDKLKADAEIIVGK